MLLLGSLPPGESGYCSLSMLSWCVLILGGHPGVAEVNKSGSGGCCVILEELFMSVRKSWRFNQRFLDETVRLRARVVKTRVCYGD